MARSARDPGQFRVWCGGYVLTCVPDGLPLLYEAYKQQALLVDEVDLHVHDVCCVTVTYETAAWPCLVVAQGYTPSGVGFDPGVLLVPETDTVFIAAGSRMVAYRLTPPERVNQARVDTAFVRWARHGDVVLMLNEMELTAWDVSGRKLWTTQVDAPWDHRVEGDVMVLEIKGQRWAFPLRPEPT